MPPSASATPAAAALAAAALAATSAAAAPAAAPAQLTPAPADAAPAQPAPAAAAPAQPAPARPAARPARVCILPGDTASAAMAAALDELRADPALAGIDFRVFANPAQAEIGGALIRDAGVLLINTHGRVLLNAVIDHLPAIRANGGRVWAVGSSFDPDFPELGLERDDALTAYFTHGGRENLRQLVRAALARTLRPGLAHEPPAPVIASGFYDLDGGRCFERFEDYAAAYFERHPAHAPALHLAHRPADAPAHAPAPHPAHAPERAPAHASPAPAGGQINLPVKSGDKSPHSK
ncbi:MAG: hypothetical protein LBC18_00780, partial [Opitutaceae bacterium]|nr:hypothetical protein [Opitutaceae bacterium]